MSQIAIQKIPPTGAKYVIEYQTVKNPLIINSYSDNYLHEVLTKYILKGDRYLVILIQHNNKPITVVIRQYRLDPNNRIRDFIQIITDNDIFMTRNEIIEYLNTKRYIRLECV